MSSIFWLQKILKIDLNSLKKMYIICAVIRNALTCMHKSTTSHKCGLDPRPVKYYFLWVKKHKIKATIIGWYLVFHCKTKTLRQLLRGVPLTECSWKKEHPHICCFEKHIKKYNHKSVIYQVFSHHFKK